jgi:hypothetical protein
MDLPGGGALIIHVSVSGGTDRVDATIVALGFLRKITGVAVALNVFNSNVISRNEMYFRLHVVFVLVGVNLPCMGVANTNDIEPAKAAGNRRKIVHVSGHGKMF